MLSQLKRLNFRLAALFAAGAAMLLLSKPDRSMFIAGSILVAIGLFIRLWATGHLQKNLVLSTTGPFAYVRNPLYLGTLCIGFGFLLASSNPGESSRWILFVGAPAFAVFFFAYYFPYKLRREGDRLATIFGEEAARYARSVPALVPSLHRYEGPRRDWSARLVLGNSEHWTILACLAGLTFIALRLPR